MKPFDIRVIETVIVIVAYIVCFFMTKVTVNKFLKNTQLQRGRRKIMIKAFNLISLFAAILLIGAIWGLKQNQIALFTSTILTALGIAFFAQWSLLSNITSSIILFFDIFVINIFLLYFIILYLFDNHIKKFVYKTSIDIVFDDDHFDSSYKNSLILSTSTNKGYFGLL
jgi:hypothetical protein